MLVLARTGWSFVDSWHGIVVRLGIHRVSCCWSGLSRAVVDCFDVSVSRSFICSIEFAYRWVGKK